MKFLVVDDDPIILKLLTEVLIGFGYEDVVSSRSAFEALRAIDAQESPFDCVMLDIQMPEMDGIELCRVIRAMPGYGAVPIIMITVMQDISYIRSAFAAGATDYTIKPFDVMELIERIRLAEEVKDPDMARQVAMSRSRALEEHLSIDNLVNRTALENYVRNCRTQKLTVPAAMALRITPVDGLVINEVANALVRVFGQSEVFLSYLGGGEFLLVCDRFTTVRQDEIRAHLGTYFRQIQTRPGYDHGYEFQIGNWVMPRPYERASDMAFLNRAVAERRNGWWNKAKSKSGNIATRLLSTR